MVPARNKAKSLSLVNHTAKTILHHHHHANVILQCFNVIPVLWSSNDQITSTLSSSLRKMFLFHSPKSPIDPLSFPYVFLFTWSARSC